MEKAPIQMTRCELLKYIQEELYPEIDQLRNERDALLACRHGDQRCFECPDTTCGDNLKAKSGGVE